MKFQDTIDRFGVSEIVARVYESLEPLATEDEAGGFPLLWWTDALAGQADLLESFVRARNGRDGWANTVDARVAPDEAIPWLGQFVGVAVDEGARSTPRQQVLDHQGFARGSVPGIIAIVKSYLINNQRVTIAERSKVVAGDVVAGSAWQYVVMVRAEDLGTSTYDELTVAYPTYTLLAAGHPTYATMSTPAIVLAAAIQESKPGGDLAYLIIVPGAVYSDLPTPFPTYTALAAAFPTYDDLLNYDAP